MKYVGYCPDSFIRTAEALAPNNDFIPRMESSNPIAFPLSLQYKLIACKYNH